MSWILCDLKEKWTKSPSFASVWNSFEPERTSSVNKQKALERTAIKQPINSIKANVGVNSTYLAPKISPTNNSYALSPSFNLI